MWEFLVDEDMPRSMARYLRQAGYVAHDVRDVGLGGHSDTDIFAHAQSRSATLVTADLGFANVLSFPLGAHTGIIVMRVPNELRTEQVNQQLVRALEELGGQQLAGLLIIVEIGRVRIRRPRL